MRKKTARPTSPGEMLREEFLAPMGVSQEAFAKHLGVSFVTINKLINGRTRVTPEMALKIGAALGTTPDVWLNLQKAVDLFDLQEAGIELPGRLPQAS